MPTFRAPYRVREVRGSGWASRRRSPQRIGWSRIPTDRSSDLQGKNSIGASIRRAGSQHSDPIEVGTPDPMDGHSRCTQASDKSTAISSNRWLNNVRVIQPEPKRFSRRKPHGKTSRIGQVPTLLESDSFILSEMVPSPRVLKSIINESP